MFDSGVGGLAVLAEVRRLLPGEDVLYYADTAHFPYGPLSREDVRAHAEQVTRELLGLGAKLIVVACNTATSAAIASLRATFEVPFVGMEPALKPAAERTRAGKVALLVTPGTARGEKLSALIDRHGCNVAVKVIEAPGLADAVEAGTLAAPETLALVRRYADEVHASGADVVALGCTHYAFLRAAFERELGAGLIVIEPSEAVARQVARVLDESGLRNPREDGGRVEYLCSGDAAEFARVRALLMEEEVEAR
jgi:glutamate racemase